MSCGFYRSGSAYDSAAVEAPRDTFVIVLMDVAARDNIFFPLPFRSMSLPTPAS
jgi:hypothetical protein